MPCSYYLPGEQAEIEASEQREKAIRLKSELDLATRLLCFTLDKITIIAGENPNTLVEAEIDKILNNKEVAAWLALHKKMDEERLAEENRQMIEKQKRLDAEKEELKRKKEKAKRVASALSKLSAEEKGALGLNKSPSKKGKRVKK